MILDKRKLIFIHIPKTGGSSIKHSILGRYASSHDTAEYYKKKSLSRWNNYFKFSVIRNPWDRISSIYHFYKYGTHKANADIKIKLKNTSFEDFVHQFSEGKEEWLSVLADEKLANQFYWISIGDKLCLDHLIRFESLQEGFNELCKKIKIRSKKLPHLKKMNVKNHYKSVYNNETKDLVYKKCKKDIDYFGYEF